LVAEQEGIGAQWFSFIGPGREDTPTRLSKKLKYSPGSSLLR